MKKIFLVRHSNAEDLSISQDDFERVLTRNGIEKAISMAEELMKYYSENTTMISSSAPRALQTAEIFAQILGYPISEINSSDLLYHYDTFEQFIAIISEIQSESVWIFGHNPMMLNLSSTMSVKSFDSFPKSAVSCFNFNVDSFSKIEKLSGEFLFFKTPSV